MEVRFEKTSIITLESLREPVLSEVSDALYALQAAPNIEALVSVLGDDVELVDDMHFNIAIKLNYQHVAACLKVELKNNEEVIVTLNSYD
ncbi:hypothetical protein LCGC14_2522830 [marine sediment metagenome]|uniref:Uncharacterized protein n=2 Tax=root TaxID=1 RepID=A0A7V1CWC4_9GAMM|nr:hypothetical protein [Pseudoalteromonas prydzensis]HEA15340.1 hypothetical protein [Pseudoalteromonas prydzensis]